MPLQVSHYLRKLTKLPIRLQELEQTGIGKTVNALRKADGNIAEEATLLVTKWKANVKKQMEDEEALQQSRSEDAEHGDQSDNSAPPSPVQHDGGAAVSPESMGVAYDDDDEEAGADCGSDYGSSAQPRITARESDGRHAQSASKGRPHPVAVQREDSHKRKRSDEDRERSGGSKKERHKRMATDERRRAEEPIPAAKCEPVTVKREPVDGFGDYDAAAAAGDFGERRESAGDQRRRESDKSLKKEHERRHHKSARHEKPSSTTAQREGRHHREDRGHREDRDHRKDRDHREDRHRGQHHEKRQRESADEKHESSRKHRHGEKKSKTRDDREANHSRAENRKSSKESSEADRRKAASREAESYRGEDVAGEWALRLVMQPAITNVILTITSIFEYLYREVAIV